MPRLLQRVNFRPLTGCGKTRWNRLSTSRRTRARVVAPGFSPARADLKVGATSFFRSLLRGQAPNFELLAPNGPVRPARFAQGLWAAFALAASCLLLAARLR